VQVAGLFGGAAISFVTIVLIARGLGPATFGHYAAAVAFMSIPVIIADAGLSTHVLREISRSPRKAEWVIGASLPLRAAISVAVVAGAIALSRAMPLDGETRDAIAIAGCAAVLNLMNLALMPVLMAQLRMGWSVLATTAGRILTLGLTAFALWSGGGLTAVMWAYVAGSALTLAIDVTAVRRLVRLKPSFDWTYSRRLLRESIPLGAAQGIGQLYYRIDLILLSSLRPAREVGLYAAAFKFIELGQMFAASLLNSIFAPLSRFVATGDQRLRPFVQQIFDALVFISLPVVIIGMFFAERLMVVVGGAEFADGGRALQILSLYPLVGFLTSFIERGVVAAGRDKLLAGWNAVFLIVNVVAIVLFVPRFGYLAAAVAAVVAEAMGLIVGAVLIRRIYGFLPALAGALPIICSAAASALVILVVPGPELAVAAAAMLGYCVILAVVPGSIRTLGRDVLGALRGRRTLRGVA
jgi:O-antigen/teichoic acid export membrane protein